MFNEIAEKMDSLCRETALTCKNAYDRLQAAESANRTQQRPDESSIKYQARRAVAENELDEAKKQVSSVKFNLPDEANAKAKALRRELEAAVAKKYAASPDDLDANVLTLLQSGILKPDEYARLYDAATNPTMRRLIGKAAGDAAQNVKDNEGARILRSVEYAAQNCNGKQYFDAFEGLSDILRRVAKNPGLYSHYENLAAPYLAVLNS